MVAATKSRVAIIALYILSIASDASARQRWLERDGRSVRLYPRRFGQENPAVIDKLSSACPGQVCGTLAGQAITPLLAAQGECTQQDLADSIIDAAQQFDDATKANMIALAREYRQAEKNTPPDFSTNPPTLRNSVFCQKAPKHAELNGLVQAQDPANDPDVFFDPATKASVKKGSQANTFPFGSSGTASTSNSTDASATITSVPADDATTTSDPCIATVTVTVSADDAGKTTSVVSATISASISATESASLTSSTVAAATATASAASSSDIGDFGSCSVPQIEFGVGFDNRKETSFEPVDKTSFDHGSAQAIGIISQFICDTLTNKCKADQTAKDTCAKAQAAANAQPPKTGAQADAFNAVFNITTDFAAVAVVDDQGRVVTAAGGDAPASSASASAATPASASSTEAAPAASSPASGSVLANAGSKTGSVIGDFGKCSVPQIEFGTGFDGRKETSFEPVDKASYQHDSAQNGDIITQFMCDNLVNTCGADATAQATCAKAKTAFDSKPAKTGAQADAFNAVFGIKTNFAAVAAVDNQGDLVGASAATPAKAAASSKAVAPVATATEAATTSTEDSAMTSAAPKATATVGTSSAATGKNLQTFTGALGGVTAPPVTASGTQFQVEGNSAFNNLTNALTRSCDVQHNKCANAANSSGNKGDLTVDACGAQQQQCDAAHS